MRYAIVIVVLSSIYNFCHCQELYRVDEGEIQFLSEAPLEMIKASSQQLKGLIDPERKALAFTIDMVTFEGFNSPLQKTHFNENYMESGKYPAASFSGKFIEDIDFDDNGEFMVRVKGMLNIHGVKVERIIKGTLSVDDGEIYIRSDFSVPLHEHEIKIPSIVNQRIAEQIQVTITAKLSIRDV